MSCLLNTNCNHELTILIKLFLLVIAINFELIPFLLKNSIKCSCFKFFKHVFLCPGVLF